MIKNEFRRWSTVCEMSDLTTTGTKFEVAVRLQRAADLLSGLTEEANSTPVSDSGQADLRWAGEFLTTVDWREPSSNQEVGLSSALAYEATESRPHFFGALERAAAGSSHLVKNGDELIADLSSLYRWLNSGASPEAQSPSQRALKLGANLLAALSMAMLAELRAPRRARSELFAGEISFGF